MQKHIQHFNLPTGFTNDYDWNTLHKHVIAILGWRVASMKFKNGNLEHRKYVAYILTCIDFTTIIFEFQSW